MATRRIQRTKNGQYIITLPKALVEALGGDKGTAIEFSVVGEGELRLRMTDGKKR